MNWLLLLIGLLAAPTYAWHLWRGWTTDRTAGVGWDVSRQEHPVVFRMAMTLNAMFLGGSLLLIYLAFRDV